MRTTVTLDEDLVREIRKRTKLTDKSFERVLNDTLRLALGLSPSSILKMKRFRIQPHSSPFRTGVDIDGLDQLADQLELEERHKALRRNR